MSTYKEFERYVKSNYKVGEKKKDAPDGFMQLLFKTTEGRSQVLMIN